MVKNLAFVLLALQSSLASGFSARSVEKPFAARTEMKSSMSSFTEKEAQILFNRARECAFSDTCSIEESESCLIDVLNLQVACASGTVHGHELCDDQLETAEIVARLRDHVKNGPHGLTTSQQSAMTGSALTIAFLALTCASMLLSHSNPNVEPFTLQEIMWAAKGGYLDDLVSHFVRNGGLLVGDADVMPITFNEVVMATRGGYLDDLVHHWIQNGGMI